MRTCIDACTQDDAHDSSQCQQCCRTRGLEGSQAAMWQDWLRVMVLHRAIARGRIHCWLASHAIHSQTLIGPDFMGGSALFVLGVYGPASAQVLQL